MVPGALRLHKLTRSKVPWGTPSLGLNNQIMQVQVLPEVSGLRAGGRGRLHTQEAWTQGA